MHIVAVSLPDPSDSAAADPAHMARCVLRERDGTYAVVSSGGHRRGAGLGRSEAIDAARYPGGRLLDLAGREETVGSTSSLVAGLASIIDSAPGTVEESVEIAAGDDPLRVALLGRMMADGLPMPPSSELSSLPRPLEADRVAASRGAWMAGATPAPGGSPAWMVALATRGGESLNRSIKALMEASRVNC